jgi:hypothetical protein
MWRALELSVLTSASSLSVDKTIAESGANLRGANSARDLPPRRTIKGSLRLALVVTALSLCSCSSAPLTSHTPKPGERPVLR